MELGKLAVYHGLQNSNTDTVLIGMNNRKMLNYNLDVLLTGLNEEEVKVYEEVKRCYMVCTSVIINLKLLFYRILGKLPANSHWENVELEQFRNSQFQFAD